MEPMSGKTAVTTAGTAVALGSGVVNGALMVKADPENTGFMYVGNDGNGDVSSANGMNLDASEMIVFEFVGNLADIFIDSSVNGETVEWIRLSGKVQ